MGGVVLETLSNRKLITLGVILLLIQIGFFLLGGLIAPAPSNAQVILGTHCVDRGNHRHKKAWFYPRGEGSCDRVSSVVDPIIQRDQIVSNQMVFSFQFPTPKGGQELDMSRYFQNIMTVLQADFVYKPEVKQSKNPVMSMEARLAYKNIGDGDGNWTELVSARVDRNVKCEIVKTDTDYPLRCDLLPFFELGSCHYDHYLVNIRVPVNTADNRNLDIGALHDIWLVAIHQNGGFTKVWFSIKTVVFPCLLAALVWFWRRIAQLERSPNLLEKTLFALGLTLSFLNMPIEWFTIYYNMPFMLLLSDLRQGIFYAILLSFWIIFAGEHMMDQVERNRLVMYWKHLTAVIFGCICLFVFEMCERGVQLQNPFFSIWVTEVGTNLALAFIILAGLAAGSYFLLLSYMIFKVFRNISAKKTALPSMSKARRKYYSGLIFRFKFLTLGTLVCAAVTVIFFIISQVSEGTWKWSDDYEIEHDKDDPNNSQVHYHLEYTSAFFTGVYGMWNVYVFLLLSLYAPSHKYKPIPGADLGDNSGEEEVEFSTIPTEMTACTAVSSSVASPCAEGSALTAFIQKAAAD